MANNFTAQRHPCLPVGHLSKI